MHDASMEPSAFAPVTSPRVSFAVVYARGALRSGPGRPFRPRRPGDGPAEGRLLPTAAGGGVAPRGSLPVRPTQAWMGASCALSAAGSPRVSSAATTEASVRIGAV